MIAQAETLERTVAVSSKQRQFCRSPSTYRGFCGGRGSGKSWAGAYDLCCRAQPGRTYMIVSPDYSLLEDTTLPTFRDIALTLGLWHKFKVTPHPRAVLANGATVRFRSADKPDKLRGPNISGAWLDEGSIMSGEARNIVIASLRERGEQGWLSCTFTPKGRGHWTYEVFGPKPEGGFGPDTETIFAETRENPFLPAEFHERLTQQYHGLLAQQELEGKFVNVEGAEWPPEFFDQLYFDSWLDAGQLVCKAMALDPSKGVGEGGDFSAIVWGGLDLAGCLWVDANLEKRHASKIVTDGLSIWKDWQPQGFAVEANGFQELLAGDFEREARSLRYTVPLYTIKNYVKKETRIRQLGPWLAQRKIRIRNTPGGRLLLAQMQDFPEGKHDDGPDALQMLIVMLNALVGQDQDGAQPELLRAA